MQTFTFETCTHKKVDMCEYTLGMMEKNIGQCLGKRKLVDFLVLGFTSMHYRCDKANVNIRNMIA